jgi:SNF2 family DNA or RNA helicase
MSGGLPLKLKLTEHQEAAVAFCLKSPYSILALNMGLGKSGAAIAIKNSIKNSRCLIICPAGLVFNWKHEIHKFLPDQVVTIFKDGKSFYKPWDSDFVILSYDLAIRFDFIFNWATMIIFDEANHLSRMEAKRTKEIHRLVYENSVPRVHLLTGTPIKNRVEEYYSLIALCHYNPKSGKSKFLEDYPESVTFADQFSYRQEYTKEIGEKFITIRKWVGLKNEDELKSWLRPIYIRRSGTPKDVVRKDIFVSQLDQPELLEAFDQFQSDSGESVASSIKADAALKKAPLTCKYIKDLLATGEIDSAVIFTDHVESCKLIAAAFKTEPITGAMSPQKRQLMAGRFQTKEFPVIAATIKAFSTGHTLTRACNLFFNDFSWVPGDMDQAEYRINRIGQERSCVVHRILGSFQDEYILKTLVEKNKVIKRLL